MMCSKARVLWALKKKTGIVLKEAVIIVSEAKMFDSSVDLVDS